MATKRKQETNEKEVDLAEAVERWQKKQQLKKTAKKPKVEETTHPWQDEFGRLLDDLATMDQPPMEEAKPEAPEMEEVQEPVVVEEKKQPEPVAKKAPVPPKAVGPKNQYQPTSKQADLEKCQPVIKQMPPDAGTTLLPSLSVFMCGSCHADIHNRLVYDLTGGRQLIQFTLCPKCVEMNAKMRRVHEYTFRAAKK